MEFRDAHPPPSVAERDENDTNWGRSTLTGNQKTLGFDVKQLSGPFDDFGDQQGDFAFTNERVADTDA